MKSKARFDIKTTIIIVFFTYAGSLFLTFWLNEGVSFSGIYNEYLKNYVAKNEKLTYAVVWEVCFFCSYIIANLITYCFQKKQKKDFLSTTKGLISKKNGLFWHLRRNWMTELLILAILTAITIITYITSPHFSPFGIVYRLCGITCGGLLTPLLIAIFQLNHIVFSQYRWRISHYMHE